MIAVTLVAAALLATPLASASVRPSPGTVFIGRVTPLVPKRSGLAQPGPLSFRISSSGRIVHVLSAPMVGNACGGAHYWAGSGGFYPDSASVGADGAFSASRRLSAKASAKFSGRFEHSDTAATGEFSFKLPGGHGVAPCSGVWKFIVQRAPHVPNGKGVAAAANSHLSGLTYQGEPISLTVNSAGDALSGTVSAIAPCSGSTHYVFYGGPFAFSAALDSGRFSATVQGIEITGTFVAPDRAGGTVRYAYDASCGSGEVPFRVESGAAHRTR